MSENQDEEMDVDLSLELGASAGVSTQCFTVYIPNKDRKGNEIGEQLRWVLEAQQILTEINGGATVMPPVEGSWFDKENSVVIWENPIVYSFIVPDEFLDAVQRIREFLHRMGRETNQGRWHLSLTAVSIG